MRRHLSTALVAVATALAMSLAVSSAATASRAISVAPGGSVTTTASNLTFRASVGDIVCNVTLAGTLSTGPIAKVRAGSGVGSVTGPNTLSGCSDTIPLLNVAATNTALTWTIGYNGVFTGTLPNIMSVQLMNTGTGFLLTLSGQSCLYRGNIILDTTGSAATLVRGLNVNTAGSNNDATLSAGGGVCPASGELFGSFALTPTQTMTLVN